MATPTLEPRRVITHLRELQALTGDRFGAQRVAFTPTWTKAREWLEAKCREAGLECHRDEAGNFWATCAGASKQSLLIGGHIDSVPNGGWLDGSLNLVAGLEVIRHLSSHFNGKPPITLRLVDWADEEGARFGRSLFGSAACCGGLELESVRLLKDRDGVELPDALATVGIDFEQVLASSRELEHAASYLELHIEQGPVLLERGLSLGAVVGTVGVERHAITFKGQAAHSGSTPMHSRRDAFLAAGRLAQEIYTIAQRYGGVCTIGSCTTKPGIVTSVVEECRITLDQRHLEAPTLAAMLAAAHDAAERFAREGHVSVTWDRLWQIEPIHFDSDLIHLAEEAVEDATGVPFRMPSGPLHDAASVARRGIPTVMLFVQSLNGTSHNPLEDTREEDLELSVKALHALALRTIAKLTVRA